MKQLRNCPSVRPYETTTENTTNCPTSVRARAPNHSRDQQLKPTHYPTFRLTSLRLSAERKPQNMLGADCRVRCYQGVRTPTSLRDWRKLSENHKIKKAPWLSTVPRQRRQCARTSLCSNSTAPALFFLARDSHKIGGDGQEEKLNCPTVYVG